MKFRYWRISRVKTPQYGDVWHGRITAINLKFNTQSGIFSNNNTGYGISNTHYLNEPISNLFDEINSTIYHPSDDNKFLAQHYEDDYAGFVFHEPQIVKDISVMFRTDRADFKWTAAEIQCSNDGIYWGYYGRCEFDGSAAGGVWYDAQIIDQGYVVSGTSLQSDGLSCNYILVHDFQSGDMLGKIIPNNNGSWGAYFQSDRGLLVTHVGQNGYRPISDGPIIPERVNNV